MVSTGKKMEIDRTQKCRTQGIFLEKALKGDGFMVDLRADSVPKPRGPSYKEWDFPQVGWKVTNLKLKKRKKGSAVTVRGKHLKADK